MREDGGLMRWEDERYVRVYTRDTAEWLALSWEARAVFLFALRKCDRAGILPVGRSGTRGLAGLLGMPPEVVARALPELTGDGCLREADASYIIPNFLEAQESRSTDAQRKRDQRERDRARVLAQGITSSPSSADKLAEMDRRVTDCDEKSPAVTTEVTSGHQESPAVTPSRAVPSRAEPKKKLAGSAPADPREGGDATYKALVAALFVLFREHKDGHDYDPSGKDWTALADLRKRHDGSEIIRRWAIGLQARYGARCATFWALRERWNDCAQPEAQGGAQGIQKRPELEVGGGRDKVAVETEVWAAYRENRKAEGLDQ